MSMLSMLSVLFTSENENIMETKPEIHKICRCCLQQTRRTLNMLEECFNATEKSKTKLINGYLACSGLSPKHVAPATANICEPCKTVLEIAYEFRELCRKSNRVYFQHLMTPEESKTVAPEADCYGLPPIRDVVLTEIKEEIPENDRPIVKCRKFRISHVVVQFQFFFIF
jgi:Zinc-finger associated domain (zf-AD)